MILAYKVQTKLLFKAYLFFTATILNRIKMKTPNQFNNKFYPMLNRHEIDQCTTILLRIEERLLDFGINHSPDYRTTHHIWVGSRHGPDPISCFRNTIGTKLCKTYIAVQNYLTARTAQASIVPP